MIRKDFNDEKQTLSHFAVAGKNLRKEMEMMMMLAHTIHRKFENRNNRTKKKGARMNFRMTHLNTKNLQF